MKPEKIRYCLLAKSIPEYSKRDGCLYTCSLGYSPEKGLIRVYPLPLTLMKKWGVYEIEVCKNKMDSRTESWKLHGYARHENWKGVEAEVKYLHDAHQPRLLQTLSEYACQSISQLNSARKSIGIVSASSINSYWNANKRYVNERQAGLFEDVQLAGYTAYTKETKLYESRISFRDGDGKHDLQLNEWGIYEYQRKFGAQKDAFRFINNKPDSFLLIGNMHSYRNVWMTLTNLQLPSVQQLQIDLFTQQTA